MSPFLDRPDADYFRRVAELRGPAAINAAFSRGLAHLGHVLALTTRQGAPLAGLSGDLQAVIPALGTASYSSLIVSTTGPALGVQAHRGPEVPKGRVWYVLAADGAHDDPVTRRMRLAIQTAPSAAVVALAVGDVPQFSQLPLGRPLYLGPGAALHINAPIAAPQQLTLHFVYLDLPLGEEAAGGL